MLRVLISISILAIVNGEAVRAFRWFGAPAMPPSGAVPHVVASPSDKPEQAQADAKPPPSDEKPKQQKEEDAPLDDLEEEEEKPGQKPPLIKKLEIILAELKERRDNIKHLEVTVAQEKTMLEEGRQMHSAASTRRGKATFEQQVKNSEQIFKDTTNMLSASREEAASASKALLSEMAQSKKLIQKIQSEARALQKDLDHDSMVPAKSKTAEDDADDGDDEAADVDQE
eukprot:gnl/MRDRNA2_/MRDRNA2_87376_c0_seq1.p1 gnl/MRDRNA2_/MRDRNA2_87376_c0~~gnl/MRDRNA2_/MRDRNA2_87376_c0_seq1.p1  ORF type:complete len:228 (+),score=76.48 gnl/MRDRNA2_/MRDRNA2_87376_c0_seq1:95-778(+)